MKTFLPNCFIILLPLIFFTAKAEVIEIKNDHESLTIPDNAIEILEEGIDKVSIEQVLSAGLSSAFKKKEELDASSAKSYWMRFKVKNSAKEKTIFHYDYAHVSKVDFYTPDSKGAYVQKESGAETSFERREIQTTTPAFFINESDSATTYYMHVSSASVNLPLKIVSHAQFYQNDRQQLMIYSLTYGSLFVVVLMAMSFYFFNRDNRVLYYSLYALSSIGALICFNGLSYELLENLSLKWTVANNDIMILICLYLFSLSVFSLNKELFQQKIWTKNLALVYPFMAGLIILAASFQNYFSDSIMMVFQSIMLFISFVPMALMKDTKKLFQHIPVSLLSIAFYGQFILLQHDPGFQLTTGSSVLFSSLILFKVVLLGLITAREKMNALTFAIASPEIQTRIIEVPAANEPERSADLACYELTERELQVLTLLAEGMTDKEIADRLFLSVATIKTHLRNLYTKLDVRNRVEASVVYNNAMVVH